MAVVNKKTVEKTLSDVDKYIDIFIDQDKKVPSPIRIDARVYKYLKLKHKVCRYRGYALLPAAGE